MDNDKAPYTKSHMLKSYQETSEPLNVNIYNYTKLEEFP